jgi:RNA-directed DNA polymerase
VLREVDRLLKAVDADLRKCFDRIPYAPLMGRIKDRKVWDLIRRFLKQKIMDGGVEYEAKFEGTPQGATLSPLLCNIYLNPLDHLMVNAGLKMVRDADERVILCRSEKESESAMKLLIESAGRELHPEKTRTVNMSQRAEFFEFFGYRFKRARKGKLVQHPGIGQPDLQASLPNKLRYRDSADWHGRRVLLANIPDLDQVPWCTSFV